jgi:hypothetical protein
VSPFNILISFTRRSLSIRATLLTFPSISKELLLLLLSLSRVFDGTESGEDLTSKAVRVVGGDAATPVVAADLLL